MVLCGQLSVCLHNTVLIVPRLIVGFPVVDRLLRLVPVVTLSFVTVISISACTTPSTRKVSFDNPPPVGTWLRAQRELVACETPAAATYMANLGFFHIRCIQLDQIGNREYHVVARQRVKIPEGSMWLLKVKKNEMVYWVPIPWHDWA